MKTRALRPAVRLGLSHWLGVRVGKSAALEEFKRFVRWLRLPHLPPGKKNVRSFNDLTGRKFGFLRI